MDSTNWERIVEWDIETWKRAFEFWENSVDWTHVEYALEIGARNGGPSLWLAEKGIEVDCTDRKEIFSTAQPRFLDGGGIGQVNFFNLDVMELDEFEKYDLIVSKSVLGGLGGFGKPEKISEALNRISKALKPGGYFLFAENLVSSPIHQYLRKKTQRWWAEWHYLKVEEMEQLCSIFSEHQLFTTGFFATLGRNEQQRKALGKLDDMIQPFIPRSWNYLGYGWARK